MNCAASNLKLFQSYKLSFLHSSNLTLFQSYTIVTYNLLVSHSSNVTLFQSHTIQISHSSQVSPAIILITRGAPDGGILQCWLFTSRSQNLVSGKLRSLGFWSWSNFFKWNRVKMAKNGQKMAEIFLGASHMKNDNIFNIFCFSTFSLGYFWDPVFKAIFLKFI